MTIFSKHIKAIFWDNDGVLVDTEQIFYQANRMILARHGLELSPETFLDISLGQGQSVLALLGRPAEHAQLTADRNRLYAELLAGVGPELVNPGIMEALRHFHGKVKLGIVSCSRRDHFNLIHRRTGIPAFMDFILTLEDFAQSKPEPDPYLAAIRHSGCAPEQCVAVEDSRRGVAAARAAGITVIAIPHGLSPARFLADADAVIEHAGELSRMLVTD